MTPLRIGIIVAALAIAGLVAFLANLFIQSQTAIVPEATAPKIPTVQVLVAVQDLPAGTILLGGEYEGHLRWQEWPEENINKESGWVVLREGEDGAEKRQEFVGSAVKRGLVAGEPLTPARVVKPGKGGFMAGALTPGMRAMSFPISPASAVAGFIVPGSHVDVILTKQWKEPGAGGAFVNRVVSETIFSDLRVIAIDQRLGDLDQNAVVGKTATIEVSPKQVEQVTVAKAMGGQLSLSLRSLSEPERVEKSDPYTSELEVSRYLNRDPGVRASVLVAKHALDAGTLLTDADLQWLAVSRGYSTEGLLLKGRVGPAVLRGALLTVAVERGEPIREAEIVAPGSQGFLTAALRSGMRAISVAVTDVSGVSGFIAPGDRVDVTLTQEITDLGENPPLNPRKFTETIFRNLRILAIEQQVDPATGKPVIGNTATLEVTPKQAEALFLAVTMGDLSLTLRGNKPESGARAKRPFTSDLDISRAAWEFIRGLNRYGPGTPPQGPKAVTAEEVRERSEEALGAGGRAEAIEEEPERPMPSPAPAPAGAAPRKTVKVYRAVGSSTVSVGR